MFPILYDASLSGIPTNNGYGVLSDCISCVIKEELQQKGATEFPPYTLEMEYPLEGLHADKIERGALIYALRNNSGSKQLFRVKEIKADRIARTMSVYAVHISRDLAGYYIKRGTYPYTTVRQWVEYLDGQTYFGTPQPFDFVYSMVIQGTYEVPTAIFENAQNLLQVLLYLRNTIKPIYPLEYEFDNYNVNFKNLRGNNNGLEIRYGKNLTAFTSEETTSGTPYAVVIMVEHKYTVGETENYQYIYGNLTGASDYNVNDPAKRAYEIIDVTETFPYDIPDTGRPVAMSDNVWDGSQNVTLETALADYSAEVAENKRIERLTLDEVTIDFEYLDIVEPDFWSGISREKIATDLGDHVTVVYPELNIKQTSEVVSIEYDSLKERYNKIAAGQLRPTLSETIKEIAGRG